MVLTSKQEEGLKIAVERHRNGERYTTITGYAGLKTHLAKTCSICSNCYKELHDGL